MKQSYIYNRKIRTLFLSLILCAFYYIVLPNAVHAQSPGNALIRISPLIIPISLSPGSAITQDITIENLTADPMPATATVENFEETDDTGTLLPQPPDMTGGMASWISFESPDLLLAPNGKSTLKVRINVPSTVPLGGYYTMVYITPSLIVRDTQGPRIIPKIGVLFLSSIGVPPEDIRKPRATITGFSILPFITQQNPLTVSLRANNISLSHISAKPVLTITPLWGSDQQIPLQEKIIFPGKSRFWKNQIVIAQQNRIFYTAQLRFSTGEGQIISRKTIFLFFPWQPMAAIISMLITGLLFFRGRKRIYLAFLELIGKSEE